MKKLVLATAVAALASVSVAQAGSTLTGSFRYGLAFSDPGDGADADISLQNHGSRIKWKGSSAVGDMEAFANFEARLSGARNGNLVNRRYSIGLSGDFGKLTIGTTDTAYDLAGNRDGSWWNGGLGYLGNTSEKEGAIKYEKSMGAVKLAVGAQLLSGDNDNDAADIVDAAVLYSANGITAGAAVQSNAGGDAGSDGTAMAITGGYDFGAGNVNLTYSVEDEDFSGAGAEKTGINAQVFVGSFHGWYGQTEVDGADATPTSIGVGYTQKLSDQMLIWYELFSADADDGTDADTGAHAVLKYDF